EAEVRSKLLQTFWDTGFDGTALPDLERATELSRKSLYNAFGDKREMFLEALRAFRRTAVEANTTPLRHPNASLDAISAVLHGLVDLACTSQGRAGCMICNTSREAIRDDPAVKAEIDAYFRQLEERFLTVIRQGQAQGEIRDQPAKDLAVFCVGSVVSISVLAKAGQPEEMLRKIASQTISALE
ncbi:MAG: TetR/AcrR family transcriptional regulator, partial [Pseudomonadota bacterium]